MLEAGFVCAYWGPLERERFSKSKLASADESIALRAGIYLTDRLFGRGPQAVDLRHRGDTGNTIEFVLTRVGYEKEESLDC